MVRSYFIPDFTGWESNHGLYTREFDRLITALKTKK